ncbi:MAG: DNA internalization-related competence protein ComEC/Rec2 [bacterium]
MRKRPFLWIAISFAIGIILAYYLYSLSLIILFLVSVLLLLVFFLINLYISPSIDKSLVIFTLMLPLFLGFLTLYWQEIKYDSPYSLASYNQDEVVEVIGEIREDFSSLEGNKIFLQPYYIDGNRIKYGLVELDKRFLPRELSNGEVIRINLNLNQPRKMRNPGGFSNYDYLKRQGIYSQGYYLDNLEIIDRVNNFFIDYLISLKRRFINIIDQAVIEPYNNLIKAFLLGERDGLPDEWYNYFTNSGINHLLAISGLHVGFILIIFSYLFKITKISKEISSLIISIILFLYLIITGFRVSVFRASFLAIAFLWAPYFNRKGDILNLLGLAALINLLINPYHLFNIGFQLSYFVLLSITLWFELFKEYFPSFIAITNAAFIGSTPIVIYYFNLFTPVALLTNIWAIPLVGVIVLLSLLALLIALFLPTVAALVFQILIYPIITLIFSTKIISSLPFAHYELATPSIINLIIVLLLIIILPLTLRKRIFSINKEKRKKNLYYLSLLLSIIILINIFIPIFDNQIKITFIDVGQGDSILIESPEKKYILIDGGGYLGRYSSHGEGTLLPLMRSKGIRKLDLVFISHFHADHALGIIDLIGNRKIKNLVFPYNYTDNYLSQEIIFLAEKYDIPILLTKKGDYFCLGEMCLNILYPEEELKFESPNNNSVVIRLDYKYLSILLTGDLEQEGEKRILAEGDNLNSNILKIGHHGSKTSSSDLFMQEVFPEHGIISVGRNNYGHPNPEVILGAEEMGIKIWRTDIHGAVKIRSDGYHYTIEPFIKE